MNWEAIGAIAEILGATAVVVTLMYLAIQTRHARRVAEASAPQWIADSFRHHGAPFEADPSFASLFRHGINDWDRLDRNQQTLLHVHLAQNLLHADAVLTLQRKGLVAEDDSLVWINDALACITTPGGARWWEEVGGIFPAQLREVLEGRLAEPETLPHPWTAASFYQVEAGEAPPQLGRGGDV